MMNKIITIIFCILLLTGCKSAEIESTPPVPETLPKIDETLPEPPTEEATEEPGAESKKPTTPAIELSNQETISICNSLCQVGKQAYCLDERTITVNNESKTGTCRSFSRDKVAGFNRCEGFCKEYGQIGEKK